MMNKHYTSMKALSCLLTGFVLLFASLSAQAQTTFSGAIDNDFHKPGNWVPAVLPGPGNNGTIPGGATVVISSPITINYVLTSFGTITANAVVTVAEGGVLNNFTGSTFDIGNTGKLSNGGMMDQRGALNIAPNASFTNSGSFSSTGDESINNNGALNLNGGSFTHLGTLTNFAAFNYTNGNFSNAKTIDNYGVFNLHAGTLTNLNGANIFNRPGGSITDQNAAGVLNNQGTLTNDGTYSNNGRILNQGTIFNNSLLNNNAGGNIENFFRLNNAGTLNNNNQGSILNEFELNNSGTFNNNFFIDNGATFNNQASGSFTNAATGSINNQFGSSINNDGIFGNIGEIISVGDIVNNATAINNGTIRTNTGGGLINAGNFTNNNLLENLEEITNSGIFRNNGQLRNNSGGVFTNNGDLYNNQPARIANQFDLINNRNLYNFGTIENGVRIFNNAYFENNGYLINIGDFDNNPTGTFENTSTGVLENDKGGVFTNLGILNNHNEIFNFACSSFVNKNTINNYYWFTNKGIFFNTGVFNTLPYHIMDMDGGVTVTGPTSSLICEKVTVSLGANGQATIIGSGISVEGFDTCSTLTLMVNDQASKVFTCANLGPNNITLTLSDRRGNSVTCSTVVTLVDDLAPEVKNCPGDVVVTTSTSSAPASWTPPTFTDNCGPITVTNTHNPGATFPPGITPVTYSAKDGAGNQSTPCTFNVIVTPEGDCADVTAVRQVSSTFDNCGSWCGGAYALAYGSGNCYTAGTDLLFVEYKDGTALLTGSVLKNGSRAFVEVCFSGRTATPPSGSPKYELCVNSGANGWVYYPTFSGTVTHEDGTVNKIARYGPAFQVGVGANLQEPTQFGAAGWFTVNGTPHGDFNFRLSSTRPCHNSIYLEAECANSIGSNWTLGNDANASGGKFLLPPNNTSYDYPPVNTADLVSFNVNVTVGGQYRIFTRSLTVDGSSDSYWVRVNNGNWVKWNTVNSLSSNRSQYDWDLVGDWFGGNTAIPVTFQLNPGSNTIQFSWREPNARLDKLFITLVSKKPTGLGGTATNCNSTNPPPPGCNKTVLFVVGSTTLNAGDAAVKARLESSGFTVTVKDGVAATAADATGKGIVIISSTVNSTDVNTKFRDVKVPVVTWEAWIYDDMKMTGTANTDYGSHANETRVQIAKATHPIAAGLSGTVTVNNSPKEMSFGKPSTNADVIAHVPGDPVWALVFAYETGTAMVGLKAPARRVGFFARDESGSCFTTEGWKIFDAAVNWALNCTNVAPPLPPTCNKTALFVAGSTSLNASDAAVKSRLESLGYAVTVLAASASKSSDSNGKGLVLISSTVNSGDVGTKFKDIAVPVIVWEAWLFDDMLMTGTKADKDYGTTSSVNKMTIQDTNHPIAQGVSGNLSVLKSSQTVTWGLPGIGASRIGYVPGNPNCVMLFTYDKDATMIGMKAPARRVGIYLHNDNSPEQNSTGWQLFDRTVQWASGCNLGVSAGIAGEEVLALKAIREDRLVNLYWTNNTGFKNQSFIVEKSLDGVNFEPLLEIPAYLEENKSTKLYQELDFAPATGTNFYRVTAVFLDGLSLQSEVQAITVNDIADFELYPNPAGSFTNVNLETLLGKENVTIRIDDLLGRKVQELKLDIVNDYYYRLELQGYEAGRYTVSVIPEGARPVTKKLIISK
jgi:hypothetical protein